MEFGKLSQTKDFQLYFSQTCIVYNSQLILMNDLRNKPLYFLIQSNKGDRFFRVALEREWYLVKSRQYLNVLILNNK